MKILLVFCLNFILFSVSSVVLSQTHFTLPENVWRTSFDRSIFTESWINEGGNEGLPDEVFAVATPFYGADSLEIDGFIANSRREQDRGEVSLTVEYGTTDRLTFLAEIPYVTSLSMSNEWGWRKDGEDTLDTGVIVDSLMDFYHPDRSTSGLGDVRFAMIALLLGSPAWSGESIFSVYGSAGLSAPTGRIIGAFNESDPDSTGRPRQFNELSLGKGVAHWRFSLFGEFYRELFRRLIRVNWLIRYLANGKGSFWTRVTPRGTFTLDHDEILEQVGRRHQFKPGNVFTASIFGFLELIPDRLTVSAGQSWQFKERDHYGSQSDDWDEWMEGGTKRHIDYDTRGLAVVQSATILLHNYHPLKRIGPIPFEVEVRVDIPFFTRSTWSTLALTASLSIYHQLW